MSKTVWVSGAMTNEASFKPLETDISIADVDRAIDAGRRNNSGEPLPADRFPKEIYGNEDARKFDRLPDIFFAGSFWCVSGEAAAVLTQFDLGQGALYPVKLFQKDRKTRVEGEYFCLNFGNVKQVFLAEHSPKAKQNPYAKFPIWRTPLVLKDNDLAVSTAALAGPDIWVDSKLQRAFFVSGQLAGALKEAKVSRAFSLRKCRVIENN